ncbi:MAG: NfeD family protein [Candidatus Methylomirabilales bacterium]
MFAERPVEQVEWTDVNSRWWESGMAKRFGWRLGPLGKYLLLQIPGWALAAVGLSLLRRWVDLPLWAAVGLFLLWVIKDLILFPFIRQAYESNGKGGTKRLIGARGIAEERLAPSGYVRVAGELWQAEIVQSDEPIPKGSPVRVRAVRGLTLLIQPEE